MKENDKTPGIYLTKEEHTLIGNIVRKMMPKYEHNPVTSEVYIQASKELLDALREAFSVHTEMEELKTKENVESPLTVFAYRFKQQRPLVFLIIERNQQLMTIVDEVNFDAFDKGPFQQPSI